MTGPATPPPARRLSRGPHVALTVGFLGLTVLLALSRSTNPEVLGRYSSKFFVYNLLNLGILALLALATRWRPLGALLAVASTFVAPLNEAVGQMPGRLAVLPAVRLVAGLALVAYEFDRFRLARKPPRGALAGMGAALVVLSCFDLGLWVATWTRPEFGERLEGFRDRYDLTAVGPDDVVLVGDSFVWGDGVARDQKFGDELGRLYAREGRRVRVFSLGVRGAGPEQYIEALAKVPPGQGAGVVIFSFFPNDIAPRPVPQPKALRRVQAATWSLGQSSLSFHALHDLLGRIETSGIDRHHQLRVDDYRRDDPTFPARWAALTGALDRFARLARERSPHPPLLLMIPLMVDYKDYPLAHAHDDLAAVARGLGYDVLDLLPTFRARLGDGTHYRASPNDIHCNAVVHALIAARLKQHLDAGPPTDRLGRH
jgi:hypothetical protein